MTIKVFELNLYNYYKKNKSEIDSEMNLDGLIASEEQYFEFKEAPI